MITNPKETITFHSPADFKGEIFYIPDYQRGYRWREKEVLDLLNDFKIFLLNKEEGSYSMQPIVVKQIEDKWEVVDGQQRLTTILLLLQALGMNNFFTIIYQVLDESNKHISNIRDCEKNDDINLFHMKQAFSIAVKWLDKAIKNKDFKIEDFITFITERVQFLWYRADLVDDSPGEKIFRRLNIGKIELTQSELIKALFLSDKNFNTNVFVNRKEEIARQWDEFESILQNDEFWYFLTNERGNNSPTRIEFLLTEVYKLYHAQLFGAKNWREIKENDGLFRVYYRTYRNAPDGFLKIWDMCVDTIDIFLQWYEDVNLYHLIGFIIQLSELTLTNLIMDWKNNLQSDFFNGIIRYIKEGHIDNFDPEEVYGYFIEDSSKWRDQKRHAFKWLLLINILDVIRQNQTLKENPNYAQGIFYKFPFHLFKKQDQGHGKGWDVEHIDSATTNDLEDNKSRQEWILSAFLSLNGEQRERFMEVEKSSLQKFFTERNEDNSEIFSILLSRLAKMLGIKQENHNIDYKDLTLRRNKISNLTLLDYKTNRQYKNAIFPTKRQYVRNKEKGVLETPAWNKETASIIITKKDADSAFVPPSTKMVFLKGCSQAPSNFMEWSDTDAEDYKLYILDLFEWFKKHKWEYGR